MRIRWSIAAAGLAVLAATAGCSASDTAGRPAPAASSSSPAASSSPTANPRVSNDAVLQCMASGGNWNGTSCDMPAADPAPTAPDQLQAGGTETLGDSSDNTVGTVTVGQPAVHTWPAQSYGEKPANGYYVVFKVTAKADPSYTDGWFVSPLDFHVNTAGQRYDEDNGHAYSGLTDAQQSTDLSATLGAGEKVTGYIAFDVPSKHGQIAYAPNSDGQTVAEWSY